MTTAVRAPAGSDADSEPLLDDAAAYFFESTSGEWINSKPIAFDLAYTGKDERSNADM